MNPVLTQRLLLVAIKHLIKSLYKTTKENKEIPKDFGEKVEALYSKSIASKIENKILSSTEKVEEKSTSVKINLALPIILLASSVPFLIPNMFSHAWILPIISASVGSILISDYVIKTKKKTSNLSSSKYIHDYDFLDLISDLEELLEDHPQTSHKILFVIDELDKIQDKTPLSVIKNLKMLFNQGNALFLFITTPETLNELGDRTSANYTIFSHRLFLKRPLFDEIKRFIDSIIDSGNSHDANNDEEYVNFKNYLCYMSKTNFFELYNHMRDFIIRDKENTQFLDMTLDDSQLTKANLQQCIEWLYNRKERRTPSPRPLRFWQACWWQRPGIRLPFLFSFPSFFPCIPLLLCHCFCFPFCLFFRLFSLSRSRI